MSYNNYPIKITDLSNNNKYAQLDASGSIIMDNGDITTMTATSLTVLGNAVLYDYVPKIAVTTSQTLPAPYLPYTTEYFCVCKNGSPVHIQVPTGTNIHYDGTNTYTTLTLHSGQCATLAVIKGDPVYYVVSTNHLIGGGNANINLT